MIVDPDGPTGVPITVFESGAILYYLASKTGRLLSKEAPAHFSAMQWLMVQMGSVTPMFDQSNRFRRAASLSHECAIHRSAEGKRLFDAMEARLKEMEYLGYDEYSIADIAMFPWARYHNWTGIDVNTRPNVKRWMKASEARAATRTVLGWWSEEASGATLGAAWENNMSSDGLSTSPS
jgi:GST-like protein